MSPEHRVILALQRLEQASPGRPAQVREVMRTAGWASPSSVHRILKKLEAKGVVESFGRQGFRLARQDVAA